MQVRQRAAGGEGEMPAVPITVRQLEAIVRISESLARMQLQVDVTEAHVQQAMDLFKTSTMDAVRAGATEGLVSTSVKANQLFRYLCPAVDVWYSLGVMVASRFGGLPRCMGSPGNLICLFYMGAACLCCIAGR